MSPDRSSNPVAVIMAGGSGTRFWPKSTSNKPKQLLSFGEGPTLLEKTIERLRAWIPPDRIWIVTTTRLESAVRRVLDPQVEVLAEPEGRNTAPCLYWAARVVEQKLGDVPMVVLPSDHSIADATAFLAVMRKAVARAQSGEDLITLGIRPTRPETGYGYLEMGEAAGDGCFKVRAFVEKPDRLKAEGYLASGRYLWNGGMFVWRTPVLLKEFDEHLPEMGRIWDSFKGDVLRAYPKVPAISVDYAIMEKSKRVITFPLECGWDDLGSWTSLEDLGVRLNLCQEPGVVLAGEVVSLESRGNIVDVPGKTVALLGTTDKIIVEAGGVLMIADKARAQDVKKLVDQVKAKRPDLV